MCMNACKEFVKCVQFFLYSLCLCGSSEFLKMLWCGLTFMNFRVSLCIHVDTFLANSTLFFLLPIHFETDVCITSEKGNTEKIKEPSENIMVSTGGS